MVVEYYSFSLVTNLYAFSPPLEMMLQTLNQTLLFLANITNTLQHRHENKFKNSLINRK